MADQVNAFLATHQLDRYAAKIVDELCYGTPILLCLFDGRKHRRPRHLSHAHTRRGRPVGRLDARGPPQAAQAGVSICRLDPTTYPGPCGIISAQPEYGPNEHAPASAAAAATDATTVRCLVTTDRTSHHGCNQPTPASTASACGVVSESQSTQCTIPRASGRYDSSTVLCRLAERYQYVAAARSLLRPGQL